MKERHSLRWIAWLAVLLLLAGATLPLEAGAAPARIDPRLANQWQVKPGEMSFLVLMNVRADLSGATALAGRAARGEYVYNALRAVADSTQADLRAELDRRGVDYHPLFIVNAVQVTGDKALASSLAARPDVARVVADPDFNALDDPPSGPPAPAAVDGVEWNIGRTNADDVWALGYTGQSIVVGSCDTGVQWTHPALVNQYRGGAGDHDYNWYDTFHEYAEPTDPNGHGTHTTGTMVGDDGAGNQVGMAPGAQWIACKADSAAGTWRASKYLECWQWFLAPTRQDGTEPRPDLAPHVINNSWSCPGSEGCDPDTIRPAAQALYAAGIAIAKSGGNTGPNCGTITNPGQYPELLATAAFAQGDTIAGFSSRGPATLGDEQIVKPDIAAPGVAIRSAVPGGGYGSMQGTSMAAPHTAGLIALLWSARPSLIGDLDTTFQIVKGSAQPKLDAQCPPAPPSGRPNNVWGWGTIDALAAVQAATDTGQGLLSGTVTSSPGGTPLAGVDLEIVQADNGLARHATTCPVGCYSETLLAAGYDVTGTLYGYLPTAVTAVPVISGTITDLDLVLHPAPVWELSGHVSDQATGAPLAATVTLLDTPVQTATNPATGDYAAPVAQGRYTLVAASPGYVPQERDVDVQGDLVEDFELVSEATYMRRDSAAPCGPALNWIDITASGTPRPLADDANILVPLGAGRSFTFFGQGYTSLYVGSNGYVTFGSGSSYPGGNTIPSAFLPNNAVYAFWDDLNPANGAQGQIYTQLVDDRLFVIEFYNVQHWPSGNPETFEIVLDLDNGAIRLQYLAVSATGWTSVGLENAAGTSGVGFSFHDPAVPAAGQAVVFYPVSGAHPAGQGLGTLNGAITALPNLEPIPDATIRAESALGSGGVVTLTADAAGVYSGTLCADWYTLTATAPGYDPATAGPVTVMSGTETVQDFALAPAAEADLWLTKTGPASAAPGAVLTYTLAFGSNGPDVVPSTQVSDVLPVDVSWIGGGVYDPETHSVSAYWFDVQPGAQASLDIVVRLSPDVTATQVCNTAGFAAIWTSAPLDPDTANNMDTACTAVVYPERYFVYLPVAIKNGP